MIILTIRTDKSDAEIGLYEGLNRLDYEIWTAHRALGEAIHVKIRQLLQRSNRQIHDIEGIVAFMGPGSFTGLRIGLTVANSLAYALRCPVVGLPAQQNHQDDWIAQGIERLLDGKSDTIVLPEYGAEANITAPRS